MSGQLQCPLYYDELVAAELMFLRVASSPSSYLTIGIYIFLSLITTFMIAAIPFLSLPLPFFAAVVNHEVTVFERIQ